MLNFILLSCFQNFIVFIFFCYHACSTLYPAVSLYWKLGLAICFLCVFQTKKTKRVFVKYSCTKPFFKCPTNFLGKTLIRVLKILCSSSVFWKFTSFPSYCNKPVVSTCKLWFSYIPSWPEGLFSLPIAHMIDDELGHWGNSLAAEHPREAAHLSYFKITLHSLFF